MISLVEAADINADADDGERMMILIFIKFNKFYGRQREKCDERFCFFFSVGG